MTNGTTYRFRVQAINAIGTGALLEDVQSRSPLAPLTHPRSGPRIAGDSQATMSWTAPANEGGSPITGYVVTAYVGLTRRKTPDHFNSTATTQTVTGLTNGTPYRFRVRAITQSASAATRKSPTRSLQHSPHPMHP